MQLQTFDFGKWGANCDFGAILNVLCDGQVRKYFWRLFCRYLFAFIDASNIYSRQTVWKAVTIALPLNRPSSHFSAIAKDGVLLFIITLLAPSADKEAIHACQEQTGSLP